MAAGALAAATTVTGGAASSSGAALPARGTGAALQPVGVGVVEPGAARAANAAVAAGATITRAAGRARC